MFLRWELFKQLVVTGKEADLAGEVGAHPVCHLPGDLHARGNASIPSESEHGEVLEDEEFFHVHE